MFGIKPLNEQEELIKTIMEENPNASIFEVLDLLKAGEEEYQSKIKAGITQGKPKGSVKQLGSKRGKVNTGVEEGQGTKGKRAEKEFSGFKPVPKKNLGYEKHMDKDNPPVFDSAKYNKLKGKGYVALKTTISQPKDHGVHLVRQFIDPKKKVYV